MKPPCLLHFGFMLLLFLSLGRTHAQTNNFSLRQHVDFAMKNEGGVARGAVLFNDPHRTGCAGCHSVDGSASRVGPDLMAVGDRFPRRELIRAILEPSASIAVGYGATIIDTRHGEEFTGVVKSITEDWTELRVANGNTVRIPARDVVDHRGSSLSLMPEGLQAGLSLQEFTDLVEFMATLKQTANALSSHRGMPQDIPALERPIGVVPFISEALRFVTNPKPGPGGVQTGLVWMGQVPGTTNVYLVAQQAGQLWRLEKGPTDRITLFADLEPEIFHERGPNGLLGLAFHPNFKKNGRYFLKHQVLEEGKIQTLVVERRATRDRWTDSGAPSRRLLKMISATQDHSGGCIAFGPDGRLYVGMGDTGPQQDPQGHGQDMSTMLGKILRIDVNKTSGNQPYAVPKDNPFRGQPGVLPEIWATGFREPWRFSFDARTGDLWVGDVGQDRVEEAAIVRRGENHGWNVYEGFEPFSNRYRQDGKTYVPPVFAYRRKYGNSITGGYVYRADRHSSFDGIYVCGDYTSRRIFGVKQSGRVLESVRELGQSPQGIASFATDALGNIYIVGYEGMIYRLDFTGTTFDGPIAKPATPSVAAPNQP